MNIKTILNSKEYQAIEHAVIVAAYIAVAGFLTELATELSNSPVIANLISKSPMDALAFLLINSAIAGAIKYVNLHKQV